MFCSYGTFNMNFVLDLSFGGITFPEKYVLEVIACQFYFLDPESLTALYFTN